MMDLAQISEVKDTLLRFYNAIEHGEDIDMDEIKDLLSSMAVLFGSFTRLDSTLDEMKSDISLLKKTHVSNTVAPIPTTFTPIVAGILSKIEILKNVIKQKDGINDANSDELFSPTLIAVETIELDIKNTNKHTKEQLIELNKIYAKYSSM